MPDITPDRTALNVDLAARKIAAVGRTADVPAIVWESPGGVRCLVSRRSDSAIEITVMRAAALVERATFTTDLEAAEYAVAAQHGADGFVIET